MSDLIVDNSFSKFNKEIENKHNKLKLILRNLSSDNCNLGFFHELNAKANNCNGVVGKIDISPDINLNRTTIDTSALSLVTDFSRVELFKKNHKLKSLLIKKMEIYNKLMQDRDDFQLNEKVCHIGKVAKLVSLQKQMTSVKENVSGLRKQVDIMKSQAVKFKINKRNFENDKISVKLIKEEISDNVEKISLKTETCLRKMIDINHQIDAGKNLLQDMQKIFRSTIDLNEKILIFIKEKSPRESLTLNSINIVSSSDCKQLYPIALGFFQLFLKNKTSCYMMEKCQSESEDISNEFEMIEIYLEKLRYYYESINQKSTTDLNNAKLAEKTFWNRLTKFESVAKEWWEFSFNTITGGLCLCYIKLMKIKKI